MAKNCFVVIDLGYGDAGKGSIVDFLTHETKAGIVVRFNGGAQAAHNVITPAGTQHKFSQFGSGTFSSHIPHCVTFLTEDVLVHPLALNEEAKHLREVGIESPLSRMFIHRDCAITTPYHQGLNVIRELSRRDNKHGSCAVGVGATAELKTMGVNLTAGDMHNRSVAMGKLYSIRETCLDLLDVEISPESVSYLMENEHELYRKWRDLMYSKDALCSIYERMKSTLDGCNIVPDSSMIYTTSETVIFEGAQGVLLDQYWGHHPYRTYSNTTGKNLLKYLGNKDLVGKVTTLGLVRAYPTRHGAGPFPSFSQRLTDVLGDKNNPSNRWQGKMRFGWFNEVEVKKAIRCCSGDGLPIDQLVVNHLDQVAEVGAWKIFDGDIKPGPTDPDQVVENIEHLCGLRTHIRGFGPTRHGKLWFT